MNGFVTRAHDSLIILTLFCVLIGCAVTKPKVQPQPNVYADEQWPAVALFFKEPSDELRSQCIEFDTSSVLNHCDMNFLGLKHELEQFRESNYFADVKFFDDSADYIIAITKARFLAEDVGDIAGGALAGATLMLLPLIQEQDVVVEVAILWRGAIIREMQYKIPYTTTVALYANPEQANIELAGEITAKIVESLKSDNVLSGQYLAKALQATDYVTELVVPDQAGEYIKTGEILMGDPLEGVTFSYARPEFQFDEYVVTIYPIRATSWNNSAAILATQLELIRSHLANAVKEGQWRVANFDNQPTMLANTSDNGDAGIVQTVNLVDAIGDHYVGRIYLLAKEDKIICLTNYVPVNYDQPPAQEFLSRFFDELIVPPESIFMATLRQYERKSEVQ